MPRHAILDDDGNVIAAYCGQPLDERGQEAMRALVAAAIRDFGQQDPDGELVERQRRKIKEVRERARQLRDEA